MPNYDYRCETCGHEFEVFQRMSDPKLTDCPQDGCPGPLKRLLGTGAGIIFKGSGFYETDFKTKKGAKPEKTEKKKASPAKKDPPPKKETKPAQN